ncbi:hypothetical protein POM88_050388 [Heracleum sosnowskyi]|uniref:Uncharacterized protein n=1 Tax=Heracleum sosnowskyi TaxID=360622 RepID=A0AAD8GZY4_9APIA|nr:hypothetical protein POM88_050388 [Heracleum sosnowskyi]
MRLTNNNIKTLPTDIISLLMFLVLNGGFENCFNFSVAWARTQRPAVIVSLLDGLPVRALYKFGNIGSDADKTCFYRFFRIVGDLGVADAILYRRCREIICGSGNIDGHFTVIAALARSGHFMQMVANFIVRNLYMVDYDADVVEALLGIYQHPEYKNGLAAALTHVESIYTSVGRPEITTKSTFGVMCHIHASENKMLLLNGYTGAHDCSRGRGKMLPSSG